jgi:hypothetical protein
VTGGWHFLTASIKQKGRAPFARPFIPLILPIKKPWSTSGVPHGLGFDNLRHQTPGGQTPPMKRCHHQPVLEIIDLFITLISESAAFITGFASSVNLF